MRTGSAAAVSCAKRRPWQRSDSDYVRAFCSALWIYNARRYRQLCALRSRRYARPDCTVRRCDGSAERSISRRPC